MIRDGFDGEQKKKDVLEVEMDEQNEEPQLIKTDYIEDESLRLTP